MDRRFVFGLVRDWGLALVAAVVIFVGWNLFMGGGSTVEGKAPPLELESLDGQPVSLAELEGSTVVVNFWATWCGPCVRELPELQKFSESHPDVPLLGVSVDEDRSTAYVRVFAERKGITYPVMHDVSGQVAQDWSVSTLPTTYVIDEHGHIASVQVGAVNERRLQRMLDDAAHAH